MSADLSRRSLLMASALMPGLSGCVRARFFDLTWNEEVRLHDERVVIARVKYTYERLGSLLTLDLDPYEPSIVRITDFSFDPGPPIGHFGQIFRKHRVDLIENFNGKWYLLLQRRGGLSTVPTETGSKEEWGSIQNASGHKCWSLDDAGFRLASINDLPDPLLKINMLMDYAPVSELAKLNGTKVSLSHKAELRTRYPLNPSDERIERPEISQKNQR